MDAKDRRNTRTRKNNKENAKPVNEIGKSIATKVVAKKMTAAIDAPNKEKVGAARHLTGVNRGTLSQAFLSQQAVQQKRLVAEVAKHRAVAAAPPKPLLGSYKGRVVQSKINSFRKPSGSDGESEMKTVASKGEAGQQRTLTRERTKSAAALPRPAASKPSAALPPRPRAVSHMPLPPVEPQVLGKAAARTRLNAASGCPAAPPTRMALAISEKFASTLRRKELNQSAKPKASVGVTDKKALKPSAASSLSQYRLSTETAEERRAKLAEWLASKGKALKRPPHLSSLPQAKSLPNPKPVAQPKVVEQPKSDLLPKPVSELVPPKSPNVMNTTLDLLDNSDLDLPEDPEVRMNNLVVNLCSRLEAMEVPSTSDANFSGDKGTEEDDLESGEQGKEEVEVRGAEEILEQKDTEVKQECSMEEGSSGDDEQTEIIPEEVEGASVVRYSVSTTPYLQSMKRRIQTEAASGGSVRQKGAIKDLKFLTPVRRSCRIQSQSARLPGLLTDHDPCVASLAELVKLDDDANAYIYRKNPALLEDLPDCPGGLPM